MNTKLIAAAFGLLAGTPFAAHAADAAAGTNTAAVSTCHDERPQLGNCIRSAGQLTPPRFIGPYEVRHGLLPNGLMPNPFTYG